MWQEAERLRKANDGVRGILKTRAPIPPLTGSSTTSAVSMKPPNTALLKGEKQKVF